MVEAYVNETQATRWWKSACQLTLADGQQMVVCQHVTFTTQTAEMKKNTIKIFEDGKFVCFVWGFELSRNIFPSSG